MNFNVFGERFVGSLLVALSLGSALAQNVAVPDKPVATLVPLLAQLEGKTIDGTPFDRGMFKDKVVLVMFWSTGCAGCRDKMPELRSSHAGWAGKPSEMVAVSTDARVQDLLDYERIISRTVPVKERFMQLWTRETGYKDNLGKHAVQPVAYLLDKTGKVVVRYVGRTPPEALDKIADIP